MKRNSCRYRDRSGQNRRPEGTNRRKKKNKCEIICGSCRAILLSRKLEEKLTERPMGGTGSHTKKK
jgi:hypothetical protein